MIVHKTILEKIKIRAKVILSDDLIFNAYNTEGIVDGILIDVSRNIYIQKIGQSIIKYPINWLESLKERLAPEWLKKKYPIKYKIHDLAIAYPELEKEHKFKPSSNYYYTYLDNENDLTSWK